MRVDFKTGTFYLGDCFEVMAKLAAGSVDMVLNDPPYGTTACAWDSVLPLEQMWPEYWRLLKSNGAAVLTASQPFTTTLIASQIDRFKYEWIWEKSKATGHALCKLRPMKAHESALLFSHGAVLYTPQMVEGEPYKKRPGKTEDRAFQTNRTDVRNDNETGLRYPRSVQYFKTAESEKGPTLHPTQKPVALFEYLIRTYTMPDELVLDNTAGSGTTAIAAMQSGRRWVCIERDEEYFAKAIARVWDAEATL